MESEFDNKQSKSIIREEDIERHLNDEVIYIDDFYEKKIDVSRFVQLKSLAGNFKHIINLDKALSLESLIIWRYNNKRNEISHLVNLKELFLRQGGVIDLSFLLTLEKLERLELSFLSKLTDITTLSILSKTLTVLEIENCKKISQIDSTLIKLEELRVLKLIGFELNDIIFVKYLPRLEQLIIINSNVLNGDISPAKNIDYVAIDNRRHYNYKFDDSTMKIVPK